MHTVVTIRDASASRFNPAMNCGLAISFRVPIPPGMSSTSNPPEPAMAASTTPHGPQLLLTEAFLLRHNCNLCLGLQKTEHFKRSVKVEKFETIEENCTHVDW